MKAAKAGFALRYFRTADSPRAGSLRVRDCKDRNGECTQAAAAPPRVGEKSAASFQPPEAPAGYKPRKPRCAPKEDRLGPA